MINSNRSASGSALLRNFRTGIALAVLLGISGGCSSLPDAANPVEWYKGTRDWVSGDNEVTAANEPPAKPVPGAGKAFPELSSVPERPVRTTEADRKAMAKTLEADNAAARYSDEVIRRQSGAVTKRTASLPLPKPPAAAIPKSVAPPSQPKAAVLQPVMPGQPVAVAPLVESRLPSIPAAPPAPPSLERRSTARPANPFVPAPPAAAFNAPRAPAFNTPLAPPKFMPPSAMVPARPAAPARRQAGSAPGFRFSPNFPAGVGNVRRAPVVRALPGASANGQQSLFAPTGAPVAIIRFPNGSARLSRRGREQIRQILRAIGSRSGRIHVVGHASSRTRNMDESRHQLANFKASYDRAKAVEREFLRQGVDPNALVVSAVSDQQPAFFEVMPAGEAGNRRVEIFIEN